MKKVDSSSFTLNRLQLFERTRSRQLLLYDSRPRQLKLEFEKKSDECHETVAITKTHLEIAAPPGYDYLSEIKAEEISRLEITQLESSFDGASTARECQVEVFFRRNESDRTKRAASLELPAPSSSQKRPRRPHPGRLDPAVIDLSQSEIAYVDEIKGKRADRMSYLPRFPSSNIIVISSDEEGDKEVDKQVPKERIVVFFFTPQIASSSSLTEKKVCIVDHPLEQFLDFIVPQGSPEAPLLQDPAGLVAKLDENPTTSQRHACTANKIPTTSPAGFLDYEIDSSDSHAALTLSGLLPDPKNQRILDSFLELSVAQAPIVPGTHPQRLNTAGAAWDPKIDENHDFESSTRKSCANSAIAIVPAPANLSQPAMTPALPLTTSQYQTSRDPSFNAILSDVDQLQGDSFLADLVAGCERQPGYKLQSEFPRPLPYSPRPIPRPLPLILKRLSPTTKTAEPNFSSSQLGWHEVEDLDDASYYPEHGSDREESPDISVTKDLRAELDGENTSNSSKEEKDSLESEASFTDEQEAGLLPQKARSKKRTKSYKPQRQQKFTGTAFDMDFTALEKMTAHEVLMLFRGIQDQKMALQNSASEYKEKLDRLKHELNATRKQAKSTTQKATRERAKILDLNEQLANDMRMECANLRSRLEEAQEKYCLEKSSQDATISKLLPANEDLRVQLKMERIIKKEQEAQIKNLEQKLGDLEKKAKSSDKTLLSKNQLIFELREKVRIFEGEPNV